MTDANQPPNAPVVPAEIDWSTEPSPVFTNFATVHVVAEYFSLFFLDYNAAAVRQPNQTPHVHIRVVSSLRMTASAMAFLVGHLVLMWNAYVAALPEKDRERYKQYVEKTGGAP